MNIVTTIDSSMYLCSQFKFSFDVERPYLKCQVAIDGQNTMLWQHSTVMRHLSASV